MSCNAPIGVFDSGLGGLTVLRQLRLTLPEEDFVYFGDTGRVPYGSRGNEVVTRYAFEDAAFLQKKNVKFIVAACGTVSSICGELLAEKLPVPFAGVVEHGARAALKATKNQKIGILGTSGTIRSGAYEKVLSAQMPEVQLVRKACPLFVPLVENGYIQEENQITRLVAEEYLADMKAAGVDTVILGCTHYPMLRPVIQRVMGEQVTLIDVGQQTALYVKEQLQAMDLCHESGHAGQIALFASDEIGHMADMAENLLGGGLPPVEKVSL